MKNSPKPLKLAVNALTLPENMAGIGFYTRYLLEHLLLLAPDIEITLFTGTGAAKGFASLNKNIRIRRIPVYNAFSKVLAGQLLMPFFSSKFDLVHSVGNMCVLLSRSRQVVTIHDLCQKVFPERFSASKRVYLNFGQYWTFRKRVKVIAVSRCTAEDLVIYYGSIARKSTIIHSASKFLLETKQAMERNGFLFVGTLEPGKNLTLAIEALARLRQETGIAKSLLVVGAKGWKQSGLPKKIREAGLVNQITFAGYIDDEALRQCYLKAECLIFPSIYEGFGLPILEAQSQGCPVIAANNSSLREVGGEGCYYFPTQVVDGLVQLLKQSQVASSEFSAIKERGFENYRKFDWSKTAAQTLEVYNQCVLSGLD